MKQRTFDNTVKWAISAFVVLLVAFSVVHIHDTDIIKSAAKQAKAQDLQTGHVFPDTMWIGGVLELERQLADDSMAVVYTVRNERYKKQVIDLNKSRMFGSFVGSRTKQFVGGFLKGEAKESKFDKE